MRNENRVKPKILSKAAKAAEKRNAQRRAAAKTKRDVREADIRAKQEFHRIGLALQKAHSDTYHDHESSTSDPYLKRRLRNAVMQMLQRALVELNPQLAQAQGIVIEKWQVTFEDLSRFQTQVGMMAAPPVALTEMERFLKEVTTPQAVAPSPPPTEPLSETATAVPDVAVEPPSDEDSSVLASAVAHLSDDN